MRSLTPFFHLQLGHILTQTRQKDQKNSGGEEDLRFIKAPVLVDIFSNIT